VKAIADRPGKKVCIDSLKLRVMYVNSLKTNR